MKLKVLVDNNTYIDEYYWGEPALSYYIEDEDTKILFDMGYSSIFMDNAKNMGIDLRKIDKVVISHGHNDHTGGLKYLFENIDNKDIELIAHPECFNSKFYNNEYIGTPMKVEELDNVCKLNLNNEVVEVSKNIIFLGEIPQSNNFEKRDAIGIVRNVSGDINDYVNEDSAIVYKSDNGLFIITGCSHSGICNIIEYAKKVCKEERVYGIIGGFHLFNVDDRLDKTIEYFKNNDIKIIYPCHCVSLDTKIRMGRELMINEVGVGLEINI